MWMVCLFFFFFFSFYGVANGPVTNTAHTGRSQMPRGLVIPDNLFRVRRNAGGRAVLTGPGSSGPHQSISPGGRLMRPGIDWG